MDIQVQDTSLEAYEAIKPFAPDLRLQVYNIVRSHEKGATCEMIEDEMNTSHQSVSARVNELMYDGLVVKSEEQGTNKSGRKAILWLAVEPKDAVPLMKPEKPIRLVAKALYGAAHAALKALNSDDPILQMEARDQLTEAIEGAAKVLDPPKAGAKD